MRAWVYMLQCADGRYYVGSYRGHDVETRVGEHNAGIHPDAWTCKRRPVKLVWCQEFQRITDAIAVEQAVIRGEWSALPELAAAYARKAQRDTP